MKVRVGRVLGRRLKIDRMVQEAVSSNEIHRLSQVEIDRMVQEAVSSELETTAWSQAEIDRMVQGQCSSSNAPLVAG